MEPKVLRGASSRPEWYVAHTLYGQEDRVKADIERRARIMNKEDEILEVVVPRTQVAEPWRGKTRVVKRKAFPGYVLVRMIMTDDSWHVVRETPGVTGFVGIGQEAVPLNREEAESVLRMAGYENGAREDARVVTGWTSGDAVRFVSGPLEGMHGTVEEVLENGRIRVRVVLFGREALVEADLTQVGEA